ncbi:hypothetical protein [Novosphingobium album (ex Liu et al. 2023)]|uniref:Type II toxin-antitoxin system RelE/ParE family toxin n=1 Tax=Novosphingobium album (ex Liu et al. 2023) TaxID=3031130 RepID=A0ABT5WSU7_9SPHN|nr:hypothetical protein [Novosphingobium album (ex Liu et al. 2023)]MDE8652826.1 hypothetical protein [Novosphingobium album (ex Liu et al. 2023)]
MTGGEAYYVEDELSFTGPRVQAVVDSVAAFKDASRKVKGAEARLSAVLADLQALDVFAASVGKLIASRGFQDLPGFRRGRERFEGFHALTVGPWRGVFLVSRDGAHVAGIVFSRAPHALEGRLAEIAAAYRKDPASE